MGEKDGCLTPDVIDIPKSHAVYEAGAYSRLATSLGNKE